MYFWRPFRYFWRPFRYFWRPFGKSEHSVETRCFCTRAGEVFLKTFWVFLETFWVFLETFSPLGLRVWGLGFRLPRHQFLFVSLPNGL